MKLRFLLLAGGICMALLAACAGKPANETGTEAVMKTTAKAAETTVNVTETTAGAAETAAETAAGAAETGPGPLSEVEWDWSRSGMMRGDYEKSSMRLFRENGEGRFVFMEMEPYEPEIIRVYRVEDDVFVRLGELSDRYGLPDWDPKPADQEAGMFALDETRSESIRLIFRRPDGEKDRTTRRTINRKNTEGRDREIFEGIYSLLKDCVKPENLLETRKEKNPYGYLKIFRGAGAEPSGGNMWKCPVCSFAKNEGKFCSECGTPRPK